jgi:O-antigen/teichoic acid export membrane protein
MKLSGLFKQSSIYFIGDIARRGLGFVMIPIYTRYLTPADYGIIELVELFVMVASVCFGIGSVAEGMIRLYHDWQDAESRASVISTAVAVIALSGLAAAAIASTIAGPLSVRMFGNRDYAWLVRAAFLAMIFGNLIDIGLIYQRIKLRAVFFVCYSLVQLVANAGLNVYFIVFAHMGVWGFVLAKLVCTSLGAAVLLTLLFREVGCRLRWEPVHRMIQFAGPLMVTGGAFFVMHFADRFFLNHFADLSTVGTYALAYKVGFLVTYLVGQPFGSVWNVSLYGYVGQDRWREQFARVASYLMFFLMLVAVILSVFAEQVLKLMAPSAYFSAAFLIPIVAFGYVFRETGDFFRTLLFINKQVIALGKITVSCAILNLILDWILIREYKAAGAAWATVITWMVYMVACWILAHQAHQVPYAWRSFALLGMLALVVCSLASLLHGRAILLQWAGASALVLLYVGAVWLLGYFDSRERHSIIQQLAGSRDAVLSFAAKVKIPSE